MLEKFLRYIVKKLEAKRLRKALAEFNPDENQFICVGNDGSIYYSNSVGANGVKSWNHHTLAQYLDGK